MAQYLINKLASHDLNEIADYFAVNNVSAGEKFFNDFIRKCKQLVTFPNSRKSYDYIYSGLKGVPLSSYIVFYCVLEDGIEILRVISGRRDLLTAFQENL
ncbi:plasmid stabilization system protein [Nostoc sp. PCC 7524]|uniref:type II toxin-antitoxin system RelE/ParE family toxin n=1 Tax=Nostoc sp. (strain ATCC 29411 / PCC 7524) TaxID=28072 RepID=UPI00029ECEA7|nr:type II toxin-antitoxin system RelE/ParE family toxin [Nostoc sp. PCC 7524]AFY49592.1 plasmid stabilization system protein [Nostoc sp. PCC 7524]